VLYLKISFLLDAKHLELDAEALNPATVPNLPLAFARQIKITLKVCQTESNFRLRTYWLKMFK